MDVTESQPLPDVVHVGQWSVAIHQTLAMVFEHFTRQQHLTCRFCACHSRLVSEGRNK